MKQFSPRRFLRRAQPLAAPFLHCVLPFFLSAAHLRGLYAPFALAAVASAGTGLPGLLSLLGAAGGAWAFLDFQSGLRQVAAAVLLYAANLFFSGTRLYERAAFRPVLAVSVTLLVQSVYLLERSAWQWTLCFASLAVLALCLWHWRTLWTKPTPRAVWLLIAGAAVALTDLLPSMELSPGRMAATALVVYLAWSLPTGDSVVWSAGVGLLLDLSRSGGEPILCAVYGCAAAACAACRRLPWTVRAGVFCLSAGVVSVLFRADLPAAILCETAVCAMLCSFFLRRRRQDERDGAPRRGKVDAPQPADALRSLYDSFFRGTVPPPPENPAVLFDRTAEQICRDCVLCRECWHKNYNSTYTAFNDACPKLLQRGQAAAADFPSYFSCRCVRFAEFLNTLNGELRAFLTRKQYHNRLTEMRRQAQEQYRQLGEALSGTAVHAVANVSSSLGYQVGTAIRPKSGESLCGDHLEVFEVGDVLYLLLSDGMGSGAAAHHESAMTARLLRQFLASGIEPEPALKTLNSAMQLRGEQSDSYTTLDLLALHRHNGSAEVYKYGAAPSYVKRTGTVSRINSASLPAGLQDQPPEQSRLQLLPESYFVMISDGVADADSDEWLRTLLSNWHGNSAQELAQLVLRQAQERTGGQDDCAVMILQVGDKKGARQV